MKLLNSSKEVQAPRKEWLYSGGVTRRGSEKAIYESVEGVYCVTSSSPVPSSDSSSPTVSIPKGGIRTRKGQARAEGSEITVTYAAATASRSPTPQASLLLLLTEPESGVSIRRQCAQESSPSLQPLETNQD